LTVENNMGGDPCTCAGGCNIIIINKYQRTQQQPGQAARQSWAYNICVDRRPNPIPVDFARQVWRQWDSLLVTPTIEDVIEWLAESFDWQAVAYALRDTKYEEFVPKEHLASVACLAPAITITASQPGMPPMQPGAPYGQQQYPPQGYTNQPPQQPYPQTAPPAQYPQQYQPPQQQAQFPQQQAQFPQQQAQYPQQAPQAQYPQQAQFPQPNLPAQPPPQSLPPPQMPAAQPQQQFRGARKPGNHGPVPEQVPMTFPIQPPVQTAPPAQYPQQAQFPQPTQYPQQVPTAAQFPPAQVPQQSQFPQATQFPPPTQAPRGPAPGTMPMANAVPAVNFPTMTPPPTANMQGVQRPMSFTPPPQNTGPLPPQSAGVANPSDMSRFQATLAEMQSQMAGPGTGPVDEGDEGLGEEN
jgi:hypothetical protein